jgi:hypothetical protein
MGTRSQPVPGPMPVHQITAAIRSARMLSDSGDLSASGCCSSAGSMPGGGAAMPVRATYSSTACLNCAARWSA